MLIKPRVVVKPAPYLGVQLFGKTLSRLFRSMWIEHFPDGLPDSSFGRATYCTAKYQ